jgi:hypothetical protein
MAAGSIIQESSPEKCVTQDGKSYVQLASSPAATYFTIKEWGVKAIYSGTDTFTYTLSGDGKLATVISKHLASEDSGCASFGAGQIKRLVGTDGAYADGDGPSVAEYAQQNPGLYVKVGDYYYQFVHDQAECGSVSVTDQNQANDQVKSLIAQFIAE